MKLEEHRQRLFQCQQLDQKQKKSLEDAEITSIRTDTLISYVSTEKEKYMRKLEKVKMRLKVCFGDAVILAVSVGLLGVLLQRERTAVRGQLVNALAAVKVAASEVWSRVDSTAHLKEFKRVLKCLGFLGSTDLYVAETLFAYLNPISLPILWDCSGTAIDTVKAAAIDRGSLVIYCSETQSPKRLEQALESNITVFLEDFRPHYHPLFSRLASFRLNNGFSCHCNKLIKMFSERFATYQVAVTCVKTPVIPRDYWARGTFLRCDLPNFDDLKTNIKISILSLISPEKAGKLARSKQLSDYGMTELKTQIEALSFAILSVDEKQLQDSEYYSSLLGNLRSIERIREEVRVEKGVYEELMQGDAMLLQQAGSLVDLYVALVQVAEVYSITAYGWSTYQTLIESILAKCMRDVTLKLHEDSSEPPLDPSSFFTSEDFFKHSVLPAIWKVMAASLPLHCTPLLALAFTMRIELSTGRLQEERYDLFWRLMRRTEDWKEWMVSFDAGEISEESWENVLYEAECQVTSMDVSVAKCMKKIRKELAKVSFQLKFVPVILPEVLEKSKYKSLPLFLRVLISLYYPDALTRRLLRQFIFQQLNSILEYTEEPTPMQQFIKSASWSFPILLLSEVGLNVVSVLCAMANYYGVGLEVVRTDPEESPGHETDPCQVIEKCAVEGAWVLVATPKFPSFLRKTITILDTLRVENKILNTFRLLIDLQGLTEVPDSYLHSKCVRFHLSSANMDEMEESGDIWQTVLQGQVLTTSQLDISN